MFVFEYVSVSVYVYLNLYVYVFVYVNVFDSVDDYICDYLCDDDVWWVDGWEVELCVCVGGRWRLVFFVLVRLRRLRKRK